jgi:hypothetical protein
VHNNPPENIIFGGFAPGVHQAEDSSVSAVCFPPTQLLRFFFFRLRFDKRYNTGTASGDKSDTFFFQGIFLLL